MASADPARQPHHPEPQPAPLLEICVGLAPGLQVRMDRCIGDVPLLEIITGRARLLISIDVGQIDQLTTQHLTVAEAFAHAASALHEELRHLTAGR